MSSAKKQPKKYFEAVTWKGTNLAQSIDSLQFSPDLVWIKSLTSSVSHHIYDTNREVSRLGSDNNNPESNQGDFTGFLEDGFGVAPGAQTNAAGVNYGAFCWDAGDGDYVTGKGNGSRGTTMTTIVKSSPERGFSVSRYTGSGGNNSYWHALGKQPDMIFVKRIDQAENWAVRVNTDCSPIAQELRFLMLVTELTSLLLVLMLLVTIAVSMALVTLTSSLPLLLRKRLPLLSQMVTHLPIRWWLMVVTGITLTRVRFGVTL